MSEMSARIAQFCRTAGLRMNKELGQHFLIDQSALDAILDAAQIRPDDRIVEIGSGIGVLTVELLKRTPYVTTVELDARMIPLLRLYVELDEGARSRARDLTVINDNALNVSFPAEPYKIVANIPYHITSPLLRRAFLESPRPPTSLTLLIQREVAENICDTKNAGLLTIVVGLFGTPRMVKHVPPGSFLPPPKVDSAVIHIDCFAQPLAEPAIIDEVLRLVKAGYSQKRKMLRNTIAALDGGEVAMKKAGIDATRRPQTLSVEEWIALARAMSNNASSH
jgi:16S rRNA (adenine1518-N6/adenine1519-N6)-dimethyltransferase